MLPFAMMAAGEVTAALPVRPRVPLSHCNSLPLQTCSLSTNEPTTEMFDSFAIAECASFHAL